MTYKTCVLLLCATNLQPLTSVHCFYYYIYVYFFGTTKQI